MTKLAYVASAEAKNGNVWVDVSHERHGTAQRTIPYTSPFPGATFLPEQGEQVEIYEIDGMNFARSAHRPRSYPTPVLAEGDFSFNFDENTSITFTRNGGVWDVDISASGNVSVSAEGNVDVDSVGGISFGENGDALVTDVSTSKDIDGHVTSVSVTKTNKTTAE